MAAIVEKNHICLSFGWLGSNARTTEKTPAMIKTIYIYNLCKQPIHVEIPNTTTTQVQALPFITNIGQRFSTFSIETTALREVQIEAHLTGFQQNLTTQKVVSYVLKAALNYSVNRLTAGQHYRLTLSNELCAYLITESTTPESISIKLIDPTTAECAKEGLFLYVFNVLSEQMKKNATRFWCELMMEPGLNMHTSFLDTIWIEQAIKGTLSTVLTDEKSVSLYHACHPLFDQWYCKNQHERNEICRNALKLLFDTIGTSWLEQLLRSHLTSLITGPTEGKIEKMIKESVEKFLEDSIKFAYLHLLN